MRAVVHRRAEQLAVEELPTPEAESGQVLVRIEANGICGSDLHAWRIAPDGPIVLGHEMAGRIEVGAGRLGPLGAVFAGDPCGACDRCRAGLDHYCTSGHGLGSSGRAGSLGGLAEVVAARPEHVLEAPEGTDAALITLAEPLGNALRALDRPETSEATSAVVIGAGPLGLVHIAALRLLGVARVVAFEGRPRRTTAALALGAEEVLAPGDDIVDRLHRRFPLGPDLVVEAVGLPATTYLATTVVRPGGTVHLMGVCIEPFRISTLRWLRHEVTIRTSIGTSAPEQRRALDLLVSGQLDLAPMITARIGLDEVPDAFEALAAGSDEIKVVVEHGRAG